jgi:hypothetical protein
MDAPRKRALMGEQALPTGVVLARLVGETLYNSAKVGLPSQS